MQHFQIFRKNRFNTVSEHSSHKLHIKVPLFDDPVPLAKVKSLSLDFQGYGIDRQVGKFGDGEYLHPSYFRSIRDCHSGSCQIWIHLYGSSREKDPLKELFEVTILLLIALC